MAIPVQCPECHKKYHAPDHLAGRRVKCKYCGVAFLIAADSRTDSPDFGLGELDELSSLAETGKQDAIRRGGTVAGGTTVGAKAAHGAAPARAAGGGDDMDAVFGHADFFEGAAPRTNKLYIFPMSRLLDHWLPPVLLGIAVLWMIREPWQRNVTGRAWVGFFRAALFLLALFASVWPFTLMGVRAAARKLNYELPPSVGLRVLGTFAIPTALVAALWLIYEDATGLVLGGFTGIVVALPLLFLLLRLIPREAPVTFGYAAGYFVLSLVVVMAAMFALNLMLVGILRSLKTEHDLAVSPFGPGFRWEMPEHRQPKQLAAVDGAATEETIDTASTHPSTTAPAETDRVTAPTTRDAGKGATVVVTTPPTGAPSTPTVRPAPPVPVAPPRDEVASGNGAAAPAGDPFIPDRPLDAGAAAGARPASEIVKQVKTVLNTEDVSAVVRPAVPGPWLAIVHPGERGLDRIERWSTNDWKPSGEARIARGPNGNRYALSPDGDSLAYITDFPSLSVQVWSFGASRVSRMIPLNPTLNQNLGQPTLLGFSRPDQVVVLWRSNGMAGLEVFNTKLSGPPRRIEVADFTPSTGHYAISPDGQTITVVSRKIQQASLATYPLGGGRGAREVPINEITWVPQLRTTALAYTPDGNKIGALFEANGRALFVVWPAAGRVSRSSSNHVLAGGLSPRPCADGFAPGFDDHAFEWLDNGDTYLLYGSSVVDAHTGSFLGDLELGGVESQSSSGSGVVELVRSTEEGKTRIDLVTLDVGKLAGGRGGAGSGTRAAEGAPGAHRGGPALPRPSTRGASVAPTASSARGS